METTLLASDYANILRLLPRTAAELRTATEQYG